MPDVPTLRGLLVDVANTSPLMRGAQALDAIGTKAQEVMQSVKRAVTPATKATGDIVLPADRIANLGKFAHPRKKGK